MPANPHALNTPAGIALQRKIDRLMALEEKYELFQMRGRQSPQATPMVFERIAILREQIVADGGDASSHLTGHGPI